MIDSADNFRLTHRTLMSVSQLSQLQVKKTPCSKVFSAIGLNDARVSRRNFLEYLH